MTDSVYTLSVTRAVLLSVKPGVHRRGLRVSPDGLHVTEVKAQPVDGKVATELRAPIGAHRGCPHPAVRIKAGGSAHTRRIAFEDIQS